MARARVARVVGPVPSVYTGAVRNLQTVYKIRQYTTLVVPGGGPKNRLVQKGGMILDGFIVYQRSTS